MTTESKQIAVIGASGALGSALALRLGLAGLPVIIGSREEARAAEAAAKLKAAAPKADLKAMSNAEAAETADILFLTVPFRNQSETMTNLKQHLRPGQIIVDATVPLAAAVSGKATRTLGVWQGSAAQQAQEMAPEGVSVVSALQTISAKSLADLDHPLDEDVLVCGDDQAAKTTVSEIINQIPGLRCIDCGKLELARIAEQITALLISVNMRYKTHSGIKLTGITEQ